MRVGIVGGGITGLSCAYYLQRAGVESVVFDPAPGGCIGTVHTNGCTLDTGPESWLASKPWAEQLARELGLGDQLAGSNDARRRTYVLRSGNFVPMPEGLQLVAPTRLVPVLKTELFSWPTKFRMGAEIFRNPRALPDRSVSEFVRDHFGPEAVDYLAEPLLAGVYGGSPDLLSAASVLPKFVEYEQRYGSVVVGALRERRRPAGESVFKSLRDGMGTLIDALRARVSIVPACVESIALTDIWNVYAAGEWHAFDRLVLCCGARRAAPLMMAIDERAGELLASTPYSGSAIWTFGYPAEDVPRRLDGFGFLVPKRERRTIMACTWVATKWQGRVPPGVAVLRCFSTDPDVEEQPMRDDLRHLMGIAAAPAFTLHNRWPESMPQYTVGHAARVAEMEARVAAVPGLYFAGNAWHGIGIPDCVRSAKQAAERAGQPIL
ncbi:MAG TPA: protoporphyrinogen oxidase [Bryobacteraceae bacterium]|jgi:oxygen-dependent protoporphyrinogen oxidase|nr:protoporphyrinogen oxidase [Bryobacteraceae bacterium]